MSFDMVGAQGIEP